VVRLIIHQQVQETQEVFLHLKEIQEELEQEQMLIMDQQVVVDMEP
jgi:cold shock CspA family protein